MHCGRQPRAVIRRGGFLVHLTFALELLGQKCRNLHLLTICTAGCPDGEEQQTVYDLRNELNRVCCVAEFVRAEHEKTIADLKKRLEEQAKDASRTETKLRDVLDQLSEVSSRVCICVLFIISQEKGSGWKKKGSGVGGRSEGESRGRNMDTPAAGLVNSLLCDYFFWLAITGESAGDQAGAPK